MAKHQAAAKKGSKAKATKAKASGNTSIVGTAHDPFAGFVYLKTDGSKFWAEHERKGISSAPGTEKEARAAFTGYVNDTQFA
jgi:hypothetical protein